MRIHLAIVATLLLSSPALAQNTTAPQTPQNPPAASPNKDVSGGNASIAQQIKSNLEQAGFKNIKLMPSSFIVRAEDQNNNPVMMVINPDSITTISETSPNQNGQGTLGQSSSTKPGTSGSNAKQPAR